MVAETHQKEHSRIKANIESAITYFKENCERFHFYKNFVCASSLNEDQKGLLRQLQRPIMEVNITEPFVSRLRGEFSINEPSISTRSADGYNVSPQLIDVVEGNLRCAIDKANNDELLEYSIYSDQVFGGWGVMEVYTEYLNPYSFHQIIGCRRKPDPTMCFFDPLARKPHKGDGQFCGEKYYLTKEEFKSRYPKVNIDEIGFSSGFADESVNWAYTTNDGRKLIMLCDYYEKKKKKLKLHELTNGNFITDDDYQEAIELWQQQSFEQPAQIKNTRTTTIDVIERYVLIKNKVIDHEETDFSMLPLVYVDANSQDMKRSTEGVLKQMTRPYCYHMVGVQNLLNYAVQTLANEMESLVQHKWVVSLDSLPDQYIDAYVDGQTPSNIVWREFKDNNPDIRLTPPREVVRPPIPPEIIQTINLCGQLAQMVLGSYNGAMGLQQNDSSGRAIEISSTNSNASAMPIMVSFLQGLNRVAEIYIDLMPKYYKTPRTLPIINKDGRRSYQVINTPNDPNSINMVYPPNSLEVKVEAGANFAVQRRQSLDILQKLTQSIPGLQPFMSSPFGIKFVLDNLELDGIEELKQNYDMYLQQQQQQSQNQPPNPMILQAQNEQVKNQLHAQSLQIDRLKADSEEKLRNRELDIQQENMINDRLKIQAEKEMNEQDNHIELAKLATERAVHHDSMNKGII